MLSVVGFKGPCFLSLVSKVHAFCRWFQRSVISVLGLKGPWFLSLVSKVLAFSRWFQRSMLFLVGFKGRWFLSLVSKVGDFCLGFVAQAALWWNQIRKQIEFPFLNYWRSLVTFPLKCLNGLQSLLFLRKSTYKITLLLLLEYLFLPLIGMEQSSSWLCAVRTCLARFQSRSTLWDSMTMKCQGGPQIVLKSCALLLGVYVCVARPNHTGLLSQIW